MQRIAIFALCAAVVVATVWLLVRSEAPRGTGESAGGIAAEAPAGPASAGNPDPSRPGTASRSLRDGSADAPTGGGFANPSATARSSRSDAPTGSPSASPDAPRGQEESVGQRAEPDSEGAAPSIPETAPLGARNRAPMQEAPPPETQPDAAAPDDSNAESTTGEGMTEAEALSRADAAVPDDGTLTPEQRQVMVNDLAKQYLDASDTAGNYTNPSVP